MQDTDAVIIDARGLNCPLPVLRLRKQLMAMPAGARVQLIATDRATLRDVPAFCAAHGLEVGVPHEGDGVIIFYIRKMSA